MNISDEIYFTGDMANNSGWFKVKSFPTPGCVDLVEIDGNRKMPRVYLDQVGTKYAGHCNPRFVTKEAYNKYEKEQLEKLTAHLYVS